MWAGGVPSPFGPKLFPRIVLPAKTTAGDIGPVTVSLINDDSGKAQATATVPNLSHGLEAARIHVDDRWYRSASSKNHLFATVAHPGTVWFSLTLVFPPTYKNRVNGPFSRIDLMEQYGRDASGLPSLSWRQLS